MFLGVCAAAADGPVNWAWLAATVVGIYAVEVAKNASAETFDFDSGTDLAASEADRSPFSGGNGYPSQRTENSRKATMVMKMSAATM